MTPFETETIQSVVDAIDEYIPSPNCQWISIENAAKDVASPWNGTVPASRNSYDVKIVFYPTELEDKQTRRFSKDNGSVIGSLQGIMPPQAFQPSMNDYVQYGSRGLKVTAIDPIQPINEVIAYVIRFTE